MKMRPLPPIREWVNGRPVFEELPEREKNWKDYCDQIDRGWAASERRNVVLLCALVASWILFICVFAK